MAVEYQTKTKKPRTVVDVGRNDNITIIKCSNRAISKLLYDNLIVPAFGCVSQEIELRKGEIQ